MRWTIPAALLLLPLAAAAQTGELLRTDPSRGVNLPPTGVALIDDATSPVLNPAGLASNGPLQLQYLHERSILRSQTGDGLYLGATLASTLGLGFSAEWLRGPMLSDYRRITWSASLGSNQLALGAAWHLFASSEDADLDRLSSWDLGLTLRPMRQLSLGAAWRNLGSPERGAVELPDQIVFGAGVRPFGERLTLGVDWLVYPGQSLGDGRLSYTAQGRVLRGLTLGAGFSHGLDAGQPIALQVAATVDASMLGLTYSAGGSGGELSHVIAVRLGGPAYPGLSFGAGDVALFDLDDLLTNRGGPVSALLGLGEADPFIGLIRLFDHASRDPSLRGVVLKVSSLSGIGLGKAEELRQAVSALRASGKKVYAVLLDAGDTEYLIASAADRIYAVPEAPLPINGLSASVTFLGGTMEKFGVKWDVARVGAFKNAPDQLTRSEMSPEQHQAIDAYLDSEVRALESTIPRSRGITVDGYRAALAEGILTPERAVTLKLVDQVVTPNELEEQLKQLEPGANYVARYRISREKDGRWGGRKKIAIVPVIGSIAGGKSRDNPLSGGQVAGAETVVKAIRAAQEDGSVAAIVLRVDSGGGDGLASDLMYRAVLEAKKVKPVIASMGDVAASGGYYAAMGADQVFASPTTLTGSIGVFVLKPAFEQLGRAFGANQVTIKRAPYADALNTWRAWAPEEQAVAQKWVDTFYDHFITEVAKSRKLEKAKVDAVARGRVWSGEDAKARGLIDAFGGLYEALAAAKQRAGTGDDVVYALFGEPRGLLSSGGGEPGVELDVSALDALFPRPELPEPWASLRAELGDAALQSLEPGLKAAMPFSLNVH